MTYWFNLTMSRSLSEVKVNNQSSQSLQIMFDEGAFNGFNHIWTAQKIGVKITLILSSYFCFQKAKAWLLSLLWYCITINVLPVNYIITQSDGRQTGHPAWKKYHSDIFNQIEDEEYEFEVKTGTESSFRQHIQCFYKDIFVHLFNEKNQWPHRPLTCNSNCIQKFGPENASGINQKMHKCAYSWQS